MCVVQFAAGFVCRHLMPTFIIGSIANCCIKNASLPKWHWRKKFNTFGTSVLHLIRLRINTTIIEDLNDFFFLMKNSSIWILIRLESILTKGKPPRRCLFDFFGGFSRVRDFRYRPSKTVITHILSGKISQQIHLNTWLHLLSVWACVRKSFISFMYAIGSNKSRMPHIFAEKCTDS